MPLKPCVQHLASKTGILPPSKMSPPPRFSYKGGRAKMPQTWPPKGVPLSEAPVSGRLGGGPCLGPGAKRSPCSGPRCSLRIREALGGGRGPGRGGRSAPRNRARFGPQQRPSAPRSSPPLPNPTSGPAPLEEVGGSAQSPAGGSAPSRCCAPDSGCSGHRHVLSVGAGRLLPGLTPRASGPPGHSSLSLASLWAAAWARCVTELSPQSASRGGRPVPALPPASPRLGLRRAGCGPRGSGGSPERAESRAAPGWEGAGGAESRGAEGGRGAEEGEGLRGGGARPAPARPGSRPRAAWEGGSSPAGPPPPPVTPGGRCSRGRSHPHPASPLPRLQPPPAELHYARQFRHFAKTKTRGRRKRRTRRKRRRRERRKRLCELGRRRGFGIPSLDSPPNPLLPKPRKLQRVPGREPVPGSPPP
ncbi:CMP-N-acetylneuraminate-beta-galactosamide-alpha-2,3-sialyltransferase 1 isoform X2 [Equus quagga]|uniref:CMP-N-acetylneuraminate-beta-galactosamide- alpha-2,3-sialyltransferase 1 isoform X2 n=1 Tax=Equus quagga TaxID=89248 RepID=UPI001EE2AA27|nr:CMP-N-acetylneuraminate-beta-galactosamide-alpha-2,3-sialyltransferase 1 isoform X2 [Equus quagga]